ncbi:hypothetical protein [Roseateles violae]|uniref:Uncharacterized protein n=1 Tax=Roseateles violae TaxID=3058042 RepID=A0ABT8DXT1_9BURK|nr:hypothetical protein [Pelomonas sp. PFR6]MDN3921782.1 hypothetical protein [Pelomonas sp. PFR6]
MQLTLREIPQFLPPWAYASAGRPDERRGRLAARRSFVEQKLVFMRAAARVAGPLGQALQQQLRQASEPIELWLLRSKLLDALLADEEDRLDPQRQQMCDALDSAFAETELSSRW